MDFTLSRLKFPLMIAVVGLMIGLITDLMVYDQPLGISVSIVYALLIIAMLALAVYEGAPIRFANLWLIAPLLFLALMFAVRAAPFLRALNFLGAFLLLLLLANRLLAEPVFHLNLWEYTLALIEASFISPFMSLPLINRAFKSIGASGTGRSTVTKRVIVGLLIAAPFLIIFTTLFASADLVFNRILTDLFEDFELPDIVGHSFLTLLFGALFMGGFAYALGRQFKAENPLFSIQTENTPVPQVDETAAQTPTLTNVPTLKGRLGAIEAIVVLFSVDALFLVFVAIQAAALFGGEAFLRSQGLTYSEYARRGFFELLWVAVITLSLILALDYLTGRESPIQHTIFLIGAGLMSVMTILILGSAYQRLQLYELAYGFTELRVQSHVFMIWLAVLLAVFFVLLLIHRPRLFATALLLVSIGFVVTLNVINQDAFIVAQNIARYRAGEGEELDLGYLGSLSEDAIPLLIPLYESGDQATQETLGGWLRLHLSHLESRQEDAAWSAYHVAINRAYRLLTPYQDELKDYDFPSSYWYMD